MVRLLVIAGVLLAGEHVWSQGETEPIRFNAVRGAAVPSNLQTLESLSRTARSEELDELSLSSAGTLKGALDALQKVMQAARDADDEPDEQAPRRRARPRGSLPSLSAQDVGVESTAAATLSNTTPPAALSSSRLPTIPTTPIGLPVAATRAAIPSPAALPTVAASRPASPSRPVNPLASHLFVANVKNADGTMSQMSVDQARRNGLKIESLGSPDSKVRGNVSGATRPASSAGSSRPSSRASTSSSSNPRPQKPSSSRQAGLKR